MTTEIRIIADARHVGTTVQAILVAIPGAVVTGRYFGRRRTQARIYIRCPEIPPSNLSALDEAPASDIPLHRPPPSPTR